MIFLSYASEQRDVAEEIKFALRSSGHLVFFDRDSLPIGDVSRPTRFGTLDK